MCEADVICGGFTYKHVDTPPGPGVDKTPNCTTQVGQVRRVCIATQLNFSPEVVHGSARVMHTQKKIENCVHVGCLESAAR